MSNNNSSNNSNRGGKNGKNGGFRGVLTLIAWALVLTVAFQYFNAYNNNAANKSTSHEIKYSDMISMIEKDQVEEVLFKDSTIYVTPVDGYVFTEEVTSGSKTETKTYTQSKDSGLTLYTVYLSNADLLPLLEAHNVAYTGFYEAEMSPFLMIMIQYILPTIFIVGAFMLVMRLMSKSGGGGFGGIGSVGKANAKVYMEKSTGITFKDVAGQDEAKESLEEIIDFLHNPGKYTAIGAKLPKGALLVGSPGTGKTLLAKAVAGEAGVPFFSISGSDFVEMFVGVGASRVRDLFKEAAKVAPCIIFIDEIDTIGKSRDGSRFGGNDEREQTLNQLLAELDGFDPSKGVIVLGATNRPEVLDKALLRPGRFDRRITVDRPNLAGRLATLQVHTRNIRLAEDVNLEKIAQATAGCVGADLANLVNEAALRAVRLGRRAVNQQDLLSAFELVIAGTEKKGSVLTEFEKKLVAYHEVGHAMVAYKQKRMFDYTPLTEEEAERGTVGLPRVLNMYENYPFWATFFRHLGIRAVLSPFSDRRLYELGMDSIPSESECYPAKLAHGHVQWLINQGITTIFHPCVFYEYQEHKDAQNHYSCPMVASYAENLKNNVEAVTEGKVRYIRPFVAFTNEKVAAERLIKLCKEEWDIPASEVRAAVEAAWAEQRKAKADIVAEGQRVLKQMEDNGGSGIVLAGRPYHIDPEINHGIPELIASYGLTVLTEDSLPNPEEDQHLRIVDQWVYHSRLYSAARFVRNRDDLELLQLNSFGCGLDAVTTDQVNEILEGSNKLYTLLKIDEVNNLGAVRIRIRSLIAAMKMRREEQIHACPRPVDFERVEYTEAMQLEGYTILAPQMSPIHFEILQPVFEKHGYHVVILDNDDRTAIDTGLKYVNNDACFPSITVVGQIMEAVLSGKYDTDHLAIMMTQTGGCCRASNYVAFIRRALQKAGYPNIPVISVNANGMEKNAGFQITAGLAIDAVHALVYGDLFMRCLYRVRPYEKVPGSAEELHRKWKRICIESLVDKDTTYSYGWVCRGIVQAFDSLPIDETLRKPRVGVVGEILVKYMPLANNHLVEVLEAEGAEAVVPDMLDFFNYCLLGGKYRHEFLGAGWGSEFTAKAGIQVVRALRRPAIDALRKSKRFDPPVPIEKIAEMTKPYLSLGNQYGEGWFLAGEMIELISSGVPNVICIQPFACLPNHVVGKGVIKVLKKNYPQANIAAVDYDPGASEVNQLNRIKLMLSVAKENMK